jgi:hypothetical protein
MVSDRALEVLRVIVQDYIDSKEPVASKAIADRHGFGVSAATIRNDMALLEEEELITAPHTSAGRIPTDKGYRVFVDQLAGVKPLTPAQRRAIEQFLSESADHPHPHGAPALPAHQPGCDLAVPEFEYCHGPSCGVAPDGITPRDDGPDHRWRIGRSEHRGVPRGTR